MHTKTDIFISLSVLISLIAARVGHPTVDIVAAIVITFFIAKMGFSILKSATAVLTDSACLDPGEIKEIVNRIEGVKDCHGIRTRGNEGCVNVDLHVLVDPEAKTHEAHDIAHSVEDMIKKKFPSVIDVVIHIEPYHQKENR